MIPCDICGQPTTSTHDELSCPSRGTAATENLRQLRQLRLHIQDAVSALSRHNECRNCVHCQELREHLRAFLGKAP